MNVNGAIKMAEKILNFVEKKIKAEETAHLPDGETEPNAECT